MSGYYPAGLTDSTPGTPWNEPEVPEKDFDVCVSQTLSKNTTIVTQDYLPEFDDETGYTSANTEDTDWNKAYEDCAMTPLDIINAAGKIAKALIEQGETRVGGVYLKTFAEECKDWGEDELTVMEE